MSKGQNVERTKCRSEKMSKVQNVEIKKPWRNIKLQVQWQNVKRQYVEGQNVERQNVERKKMTQDKIFLLLSSLFKLLFAFDILSLPHFVFRHFLSTFCPWTFWYRIKIAWEKRRRTKCRRTDYRRDKK